MASSRTAGSNTRTTTSSKTATAAKTVSVVEIPGLLPRGERLEAEPALAAMRAGWLVRRVGADGVPSKFMRITTADIESADKESAVLQGVWERARTDIASFLSSTFLLVGDVAVADYVVQYESRTLTGNLALTQVYSGTTAAPKIVATVADKAGGRTFFKVVDNILLEAESERAVIDEAWKPSQVPVSNFMAETFQVVTGWDAVGSNLRYVPASLVNDVTQRAITATTPAKLPLPKKK